MVWLSTIQQKLSGVVWIELLRASRCLRQLALLAVARQGWRMQGFAERHFARNPANDTNSGTASGAEPSQPVARARVVGDPADDPTPATLKLYAGDWACFVHWCREHGHAPLPASAATLAAYLLAMAPGLRRGSLGRRRAAIGTMHRQAGLPVPLLHADTHEALRRAAKPKLAARVQKPTAASLVRIAKACPRDLPGLRDRALLLLAAAMLGAKHSRPATAAPPDDDAVHGGADGVKRLFLLGLDAEHVRFTASGVALGLRTRSDAAEPSRIVTLTRAATTSACPVRALEDWLRASDTAFGPIFRKVDRWGNVEHGRLAPDAWHRILARRGAKSCLRAPKKSER